MEVETHPDPSMDEIGAGRGTEENGNRATISIIQPGLLIERKCQKLPTFRLKTRQ